MNTRTAKLAKLHVSAKTLGLDDDGYRDKLYAVTGHRSARNLNDAQLDVALAAFHVKRSGTDHPHHAKVKALWVACWNLGALDNGTDAALDAFVERQTGVARLSFLGPQDAHKVSEALKAMLTRHGCNVPSGDTGGMQARANLVRAQWAALHRAGAVGIDVEEALMSWARGRVVFCHMGLHQMKRHELDIAAKKLGSWLRSAIAKRKRNAA